jgi:hypothetical protein
VTRGFDPKQDLEIAAKILMNLLRLYGALIRYE